MNFNDTNSRCNKCGEVVPPKNDAVNLEMLLPSTSDEMKLMLVFATPRHLLPTENCEGSQSRAQYLEGQPRDTRGYPYIEELEAEIREAHAKLVAGEF